MVEVIDLMMVTLGVVVILILALLLLDSNPPKGKCGD